MKSSLKSSVSLRKITSSLRKNQNVLVRCLPTHHEAFVNTFYQKITPLFSSICMVLTTRPCAVVQKQLQGKKNLSAYHFIDCTSSKSLASDTQPQQQCQFITSQATLTELSIAIFETLQKYKVDLLVFDNLSTLFVYNSEIMTEKFIHSLFNRIRATSVKSISLISPEVGEKVLSDITLFADAVVEV